MHAPGGQEVLKLEVLAVQNWLPWEVFGGIPELLQTEWGSLSRSLALK